MVKAKKFIAIARQVIFILTQHDLYLILMDACVLIKLLVYVNNGYGPT